MFFYCCRTTVEQYIEIFYNNDSCFSSLDGKKYIRSLCKNSTSSEKIEGDGYTPLGTFPLHKFFR